MPPNSPHVSKRNSNSIMIDYKLYKNHLFKLPRVTLSSSAIAIHMEHSSISHSSCPDCLVMQSMHKLSFNTTKDIFLRRQPVKRIRYISLEISCLSLQLLLLSGSIVSTPHWWHINVGGNFETDTPLASFFFSEVPPNTFLDLTLFEACKIW